ncbi:MAG: Crp/Fnr family transcriptional regulator [Bacteroidia bacterium]
MQHLFENYFKSVKEILDISRKDFQRIFDLHKYATYEKGQMVLKPGDLVDNVIYIVEGAFCLYYIGDDGAKHMIMVCLEDNWITDPEGLFKSTPSKYYLETLTPCKALLLSKDDFESGNETPQMDRLFRKIAQNAYVALINRVVSLISDSAEKRYLDFIQRRPEVMENIPLTHIASFLGIRAQSRSRIRNNLRNEGK